MCHIESGWFGAWVKPESVMRESRLAGREGEFVALEDKLQPELRFMLGSTRKTTRQRSK